MQQKYFPHDSECFSNDSSSFSVRDCLKINFLFVNPLIYRFTIVSRTKQIMQPDIKKPFICECLTNFSSRVRNFFFLSIVGKIYLHNNMENYIFALTIILKAFNERKKRKKFLWKVFCFRHTLSYHHNIYLAFNSCVFPYNTIFLLEKKQKKKFFYHFWLNVKWEI